MELKHIFKTFLIVLLLTLPWFNSQLDNGVAASKVSQENVQFYEINPCKASLFDFLKANSESIYQDHFKFRFDNKSSIKCFGRVTGVTVSTTNLTTAFYISLGTNSFINLLFQGFIWIILFSFIPKNKDQNNKKIESRLHNITLILVSYLFTFSIYSESKFYEKNFYIFDFYDIQSYIPIFFSFLLLLKIFVESFTERSDVVVNYLPYLFLFSALFSGFNINFLSMLFIYFGIQSLFFNKDSTLLNKTFNKVFLILSIWWIFNSTGSHSFNLTKFRGFSSSIYEFNANLFWVIYFFLLLKGIQFIYINLKEKFNIESFTQNLSVTSSVLLLISYIGANFPIVNFFNYYFLGLQRLGVELQNPFLFDEYSVKIAWRGISPSAETIGEFYGICLIFLLFNIVKTQKLNFLKITGTLSSALGLYFSDNRTVIVLVFFIIIIYLFLLNNEFQFKKKFIGLFLIFFLFLSLILLIVGSSNFTLSYQFVSESLIRKANDYQFESIYSSYLTLLNNNFENSTFYSYFFSFFSSIAYFLNRSEMWGVFFSRYNPTFMEFLFGSGPLNFGQLYGEVVINKTEYCILTTKFICTETFLLPHSSFLSYLLFFGIVPLILLVLTFLFFLYKNRKNYQFVLISTYLFINIFKNDSLNYFTPFCFYAFIMLILNSRFRSRKFY
tara:strand:+ start:805 stop:2811 length:2007 start_codon:yes stop_codon:yes gene_type:complete